jgi:hypothetical protein
LAQSSHGATLAVGGSPQPLDGDARIPPDASIAPRVEAASGDYRIDALTSRFRWSVANVTYSFYSSSVFNGQYAGAETGAREVSEGVKQNVRRILAFYDALLGIQLTEVAETPNSVGMIRVMISDAPAYAFAYYPSSSATFSVGGDVHLNGAYDRLGDTNGFQHPPGQHGYSALVHELGHALGLKHPSDGSPVLPAAENNSTNTVMSYGFLGHSPGTPMGYDVLTLQYLYGAAAYRTANDTYQFTRGGLDQYSLSGQLFLHPSAATKQTLWDTAGYNTLDLSQVPASTSGYRLDLRPLGWLTTGGAFKAAYYDAGTTLGPGVRIHRLINSVSSDTIHANADVNVFAGYAPWRATGHDLIIGADETDTVDLSSFPSSMVAQTPSGNNLVLSLGSSGSVTLQNYYGGNRPAILLNAAPSQLSIGDVTVTEGNAVTPAPFVVTLSPPSTSAVVVNYATANGTASAGSDYAAASGSISFAPGETQKTLAIQVIGDSLIEADETFSVLLSAPSAGVVIADRQGDGTILNDDQATSGGGGTGDGLRGQYFGSVNFTGAAATRVDSTVDFDWGGAAPLAGMPVNEFSVRWMGLVEAPSSGTFTFYTVSDDGVRLWVNGALIIDNWTDHPPTENGGTAVLVAGQRYDIRLEYYERGGGATMRLLWSSPSMAKAPIPQARLYSTPSAGGDGLRGQYFGTVNFTGAVATRVDSTVDFDWGGAAPLAGMPVNEFSVRWTGLVEAPSGGTFTFYTVSDDGVRLWVNGALVIDNWTDHPPTENSGTVVLVAGQRYDIRLEYYERGGGATVRLLWSSPSMAKTPIPQARLYSN